MSQLPEDLNEIVLKLEMILRRQKKITKNKTELNYAITSYTKCLEFIKTKFPVANLNELKVERVGWEIFLHDNRVSEVETAALNLKNKIELLKGKITELSTQMRS